MMASKEKSQQAAEIHFEGDSLEALSSFPDEVKRALGFLLLATWFGPLRQFNLAHPPWDVEG
jgi:hypothetical protein